LKQITTNKIGHGECVKIIRDLDLPLLVLGGGGYTLKNVARAWAYDTAVLTNREIDEGIKIIINKHFNNFNIILIFYF